jgi:hypothetical protein
VTSAVRYRERLLPQWWVIVLVLALMLMLAVAYGAALGSTAGVLVGAGAVALSAWLLWITSPVIRVTSQDLEVAGARLPLERVASARALDRTQLATMRGPGADARLFVSLRPWSAAGGVVVELDDPSDPHPAWLFTSRHPARVLAAVTGTM